MFIDTEAATEGAMEAHCPDVSDTWDGEESVACFREGGLEIWYTNRGRDVYIRINIRALKVGIHGCEKIILGLSGHG